MCVSRAVGTQLGGDQLGERLAGADRARAGPRRRRARRAVSRPTARSSVTSSSRFAIEDSSTISRSQRKRIVLVVRRALARDPAERRMDGPRARSRSPRSSGSPRVRSGRPASRARPSDGEPGDRLDRGGLAGPGTPVTSDSRWAKRVAGRRELLGGQPGVAAPVLVRRARPGARSARRGDELLDPRPRARPRARRSGGGRSTRSVARRSPPSTSWSISSPASVPRRAARRALASRPSSGRQVLPLRSASDSR